MVNRVIPPQANQAISEADGTQTQVMRFFANTLANRALIISTGSPEGVVEANQGCLYMDDAGTAGNILYVKRDDNIAGDRTTGWILV